MTLLHWPYFCEENIWHLCGNEEALASTSPHLRRVLIISNARRRVAFRKQHAGQGGMVFWDYHVVLLAGRQVWDLDSTLGHPVDLDVWIRESFYPLVPGCAPRFRVLEVPTYRSSFASDRSHMRDALGAPLKPMPPWPPIGVGMTLRSLIDLDQPFPGEVVDLAGLRPL